MTLEEAVEVILAGSPFIMCEDCAGRGWFFDVSKLTPEGAKIPQMCHPCHMAGQVVRPEYRQACKLLGRPTPKLKLYEPKSAQTSIRMAANQGLPLKTVMDAMKAMGMLPSPSSPDKSR